MKNKQDEMEFDRWRIYPSIPNKRASYLCYAEVDESPLWKSKNEKNGDHTLDSLR